METPSSLRRPAASLQIVEVSPRDGLQNETTLISTAEKVELILKAAKAGAQRIEAVSFVSAKAVPQMADAEAVLEALEEPLAALGGEVAISGLVLNRRGLDRALRSGLREVNFVVVASETFNRRNQGTSISETISQVLDSGAVALREGVAFTVTIGAAFGCPFEGEVDQKTVAEIAAAVAPAGLREIALADTIGVADPLAVERRMQTVAVSAPGIALRCHFHNTRGAGLANAYAAWRAGAASLDAAIGGFGGCPFAPAATGNIATEDLGYMLSRMGVGTGLNLEGLVEAATWLGRRLGKPPSALLGRAGLFPPSPRSPDEARGGA